MLAAIRKNPRAAVLQDGLGELYVRLSDPENARRAFEKAISLDPELGSARFNLAKTLIELRRFKEALSQLLKFQSMGNDTLALNYHLAQCYQGLRRFDKAIEAYNAVLALDPDNHEYAYAAGTAYFEKGNYEKARERFQQALTLDSKMHRAHFLTGQSFLRQGDPKEAEKRLRLALEYYRDSLEYGFWLAIALEMQGKYDEAREEYLELDRVVKRSPKRLAEVPDLYYRLGKNILRAGAPQQAVVYLTRTLDRREKRAEPWYLAGEALFQLNFYVKSVGFLKEALKRDRNHVDAHYRIAMAYLLQKRPNRNQAINHFRQVIAVDTKRRYVDAYKQLGLLYRDGGRSSEAVRMLRTYLQYAKPGSPDRREVDRELHALTAKAVDPRSSSGSGGDD